MTLKLEIETWVAALGQYDNNEFENALTEFEKVGDTSKILFNMGVIHATLGEHEKAVGCYQRAIRLDQYLAVAYFQQGVSNFLLGDFEEALANFNDTLLYLRGNNMIDYAQLGLLFRLYSCEVLFNRGLCYIYLQQTEAGMQDLSYAANEKVVPDHDVINEAIAEEAVNYTVFSIPVGVIYRPNEAKVRNLQTKDYLGRARLVAASDRSNAFTGFAGSEIKNAGKPDAKDDRPLDNISFAATNLVRSGIQSRRQQSEPPLSRNVFPPTPPPEHDRPGRSASVRNGGRQMPAKLTIQTQEMGRRYQKTFSPEDRWPKAGRSNPSSANPSSTSSSKPSRPLPQREPALSQRRQARLVEEQDEPDPSDLYDMYRKDDEPDTLRDNRAATYSKRQQRYADDGDSSDYDAESLDGAEFEIVSHGRRAHDPRSHSRNPSRIPEIRKIRVKVHASDVRYIMIGTAIEFPDFADRIKDKLGMRRRFKIKIKDEDVPEGDMITLGDQDDLEMAIQSATSMARRNRQDIGKMEIWVFES